MKQLAVLLLVVSAAVISASCGDEEPDPDNNNTNTVSCTTNGTIIDIIDNHRTSGGDHKVTITAEDVIAGVEKVYDIRGDNTGHTHTLTVAADDFASLAAGTTVTIISSDTGAAGNDHTHVVKISCA